MSGDRQTSRSSASLLASLRRRHGARLAARPVRVVVATLLFAAAMVATLSRSLFAPPVAWAQAHQPPNGRRAAVGLLAGAAVFPTTASEAIAKDQDIPPGFLPAGLVAKEVGVKVVTPNGLEYEALELGTTGNGLRDGPPRSGSNVWVKFTARTGGFDGPIYDSSEKRGSQKPGKPDYFEVRLNNDPSITNGLNEAVKLMKVGGKGRFFQPAKLGYSQKVTFEGATESDNVVITPDTDCYYTDVELVSIVKP